MSRTIEAIKHHMGPTKPTLAADAHKRPAARSGTFAIGGDLPIHRLGYGAMQLTGPGVWGEPADRAQAIAVLRRAVELGINLIDTADSYGPYVSEELIREALHPYPKGVVIATKAGLARTGPGRWIALGRARHLRQECEMSLRRLGVERIDLFQLHRIDPKVSADDQFGILRDLQKEGKIRHAGLSEVTVAEIEEPVASLPSRPCKINTISCTAIPKMPWIIARAKTSGLSRGFHSRRRPRQISRRINKNCQVSRRSACASSTRVVAQKISCDAADPGEPQR